MKSIKTQRQLKRLIKQTTKEALLEQGLVSRAAGAVKNIVKGAVGAVAGAVKKAFSAGSPVTADQGSEDHDPYKLNAVVSDADQFYKGVLQDLKNTVAAMSALKPEKTKKFYMAYNNAMLKFRPTIAAARSNESLGNDFDNKVKSNPELFKAFKQMSDAEDKLKSLIDNVAAPDKGNNPQNLDPSAIQKALNEFVGSIQNVINLFPKLTNQIHEQKEKLVLKQIIQKEIKSSYRKR